LDEATSSVDAETELLIQQALERLIQGRTVFIVAHRLSTVKSASQIIVLDKGKITERGTHQQLLDKNGLYKRLYQIQEL
jgi:ABC-type multidrug transport system fused ATPase/permease subunit